VRIGLVSITLFIYSIFAQTAFSDSTTREIEDNLRNLTPDNARGYLMPLMYSIASGSHRATYHTAEIKKGLNVYVGLKAMVAFIPATDKSFVALSPVDGSSQRTATVVGASGSDPMPDGFNWNVIPVMIPQVHIGNLYGTQVMLRYLPSMKFDDKIGDLSVFGGGITHSVSRYLPRLPVQFAVQASYQYTSLGSIYESSGSAYNLLASTRYSGITLYSGFGYETSDVTIRYTYDPVHSVDAGTVFANTGRHNLRETIEDRLRATFGLSLQIIIFNVSVDYSFGEYQIATLGLGISI
jgi:hypothetical protein